MGKQDDAKIAKLVRKNMSKVANPKVDRSGQYDDTLRRKPPEQDRETVQLFKEMKKREF